MADHNFGPCKECECATTLLFEVRHCATGQTSHRVACRAHPSQHWRPATDEDIERAKIARLARAEVTR